jgi:hypothetical protein
MRIKHIIGYIIIMSFFLSCTKWKETEDVSHVSQLPKFELTGGEFISFVKDEQSDFTDPGVLATVDGEPVSVISSGSVDLSEPGVYIITYYAQNKDFLSNTVERIIAVTHEKVTNNDLSGKYTGTVWSPQVEMKVTKVDEKGLYKCSEVMGYPGFEMKGRFVDIGDNELILLHGEGFFGNYSASTGYYTRTTLSWTIFLEDEPYTDVQIPVTWRKTDD